MASAGDMTIRLFVSDVDGTLVTHAKELTDATVAAVRRLTEAGLPFTLISARPPSGVLPLAERLGLSTPVAAFNGGTIIAADGGVAERHTIDPAVVEGVLDLAAGTGADPWMFAGGIWYYTDPDNPHVGREKLSAMQEGAMVGDVRPLADNADKLTLVSDDHAMLAELEARAIAAFGDRATIARSQSYYLDVTAVTANKGDGLATLARTFGVPLEDVAVIGDMPNDLPMFARAGLAIAMGQAPDEVKAKAARVTASNEDDGVARAIDEIILPMTANGDVK
jgi:Cof subfamily protein (haloacid dehalogenase superfamily)